MAIKKPLWHPTLDQKILLKISLTQNKDEAVLLWEQWSSRNNISDIQNESYLLLQSAISNLLAQKVQLSPKIKNISRHTAVRNLIAIQTAQQVTREFSKHKIPLFALKGLALLLGDVYKHSNTRAMNDIDLYTNEQYHKKALKILLSAGWSADNSNTNAHSVTLTRPDLPIKLDLHSRPLWFQLTPKIISNIEKDAEVVSLKKSSIWIMKPEFQLTHALVHGARGGVNDYSSNTSTGAPHLRWIIDAHYIIKNRKLNWKHFLSWVKILEVGVQVKHALVLLEQDFKITIPSSVMAALENMPKTRTQKLHAYYSMSYTQPKFFKIPRSLRASFHAWLLLNHTSAYVNSLSLAEYVGEFGQFLKKGFKLNKNDSISKFIMKKILSKPRLILP